MYQLYMMSQQPGMGKPSDVYGMPTWVENEFGLDGWWTCYQFDKAITLWGNWVQNRLLERDKNHQPLYTLDMLISENPRKAQAEAFFGAFERVLSK